jgi:hypothetical protein
MKEILADRSPALLDTKHKLRGFYASPQPITTPNRTAVFAVNLSSAAVSFQRETSNHLLSQQPPVILSGAREFFLRVHFLRMRRFAKSNNLTSTSLHLTPVPEAASLAIAATRHYC